MESSEDDAGTATNASRRASAREKDVGLAEEVNATSSFQQEPSEARLSCQTPAMSEDNFDGDSVPSPSTQDVNTSTEAILDMIDEIVDGPGAPKRLPLTSDSVDSRFDELEITSEHSNIIQESTKSHYDNSQPVVASSADSAKSELLLQAGIDSRAESSSFSDISHGILNTDSVDSLLESSSLPECDEPSVSTQTENRTVPNVVCEESASCVDSLLESSSLPQNEEPIVPTQVECSVVSNVASEISTFSESSLPESSSLPNSEESAVSTIPDNSDVSNVAPASYVSSLPESDEATASTPTENSAGPNVVSEVSSLPESSSMPEPDGAAVSTQLEDSGMSNVVSEVSSLPESSSMPEPDGPVVSTQLEDSAMSNVVSEVSSLPESSSMAEPDGAAVSTQLVDSAMSNVVSEAPSLPESSSMPEPDGPAAVFTQPEESAMSNEVSEAPASCVELLPESSSLPLGEECAVSTETEHSAVSNVVPEAPASCPPPNIPSSSEEKTVQNISDVSECETLERTIKCVSSSDRRDNVTVESAESTSSDSSVSEGRAVLLEPQVRSPLRRRLVRPAPSDRRPDSTVSSTVDSQIVNSPAIEQRSSKNITKDVTSSSDAVPTIHGNVKPEEIRNVSEINFCKAETSVSSPKKIKLIRQKVITGTSNREPAINQSSIQSDKNPCQSTSSDNHTVPFPEPHKESSNTISVSQSQDDNETSIAVSNCVVEMPVKIPEQAVCSEEHSQPNIEQCHPPKQDEIERHEHDDSVKVPSVQPTICLLNSSELEADAKTIANASSSNIIQEISSMPTPLSVAPETDIKVNDLEQSTVSNVDADEHKDTKVPDCTKNEVLPLQESIPTSASIVSTSEYSEPDNRSKEVQEDQKKVPPFKLNLSTSNLPESKLESEHSSISKNSVIHEESDVTKQVPKLTIKLKQPDEMKSPVPKVTIKPIRPPAEQDSDDKTDKNQHIPNVTKINIKPILKPPENSNEKSLRLQHAFDGDSRSNALEQLPCITKLNIKPIPKPPEKINVIHRKSSSSEISESEYSENDETSTSDQASTSDHGPSDVVPKVTIKLGKPGTESEGKFYTEKNVPKVTIKGFQQDEKEEHEPKLKMVISQSEVSSDTHHEKVPKLTIKTVSKSESQPLSPKLTIKPIKLPDTPNKEGEIPKIKISTESFSSSAEVKESPHVPKITIKPVTRSAMCDSPEHIPIVTKLNIKPILKPTDSGESSEEFDNKVPVVSKLNIKPVIKPKDNDVDSSVDDVPKITKLNIKPIKNPEENSSEQKDCDELNADIEENSIPVVTKINIKPIIKPQNEETLKDSENQSSETGNSSDDNGDHIPVVTKLNIKPIIKPDSLDESSKVVSSSEQSIPVITKLNIKPLVKPGESVSPSSPKKEHLKLDGRNSPVIPVVTKLNIKPVVRPEEAEPSKPKDDSGEKTISKKPPLLMKINMKTMTENYNNEHAFNNISDERLSLSPKKKVANALETQLEIVDSKNLKKSCEPINDVPSPVKDRPSEEKPIQNCVPDLMEKSNEGDEKTPVTKTPSLTSEKEKHSKSDAVTECHSLVTGSLFPETSTNNEVNATPTSQEHKNIMFGTTDAITESSMIQTISRQKFSSVQNCTLLKKLLENTKCSLDKNLEVSPVVNYALPTEKNDKCIVNSDHVAETGNSSSLDKTHSGKLDKTMKRSSTPDKINDLNKSLDSGAKQYSIQDRIDKANESITKPLEITISDKITNQSSGQDSPRIILKINKTDHGSSAKIITEDVKRPDSQQNFIENTQNIINDKQSPKKYVNSRRKQPADTSLNLSTGKRLRSSRIVENTEKTPIAKRNMGKRPSTTETSPPQNKESDLSLLQSKRLKLGQLLSNKSLTITPVTKPSPPSPTKSSLDIKQGVRTHSILNNENCSKNGNSKLHNILSNLQAKQMQTLHNNTHNLEKAQTVAPEIELNASGSNSVKVEITHVENSRPELQEMIINENSDYRDFGTATEEVSQDPLEVKPEVAPETVEIPKPVELTPQPKKRGRPRKLPVSESAKPVVTLPVPALEERPQRSLRLMRDRPAILQKPRGRGRGRGGRRAEPTPPTELETIVVIETAEEPEDRPPAAEIDLTSSRIKLPRMTEALDNMPSACVTPLSSRRRNSSGNFSTGETPQSQVVSDSSKLEETGKTPEAGGSGRRRGGRGARGGRGRTPRTRGRGRGGGRGAMYMKETMGIYGRVCGPATTTVQLFEEETCMMDDNATPAKPSHLLDEDSQSSVKSSTNESSKQKKSKFADLFDSNKVWTAADVKEYTWPPPYKADVEHKVMMIQEQVAMFLGVKSFKRRYAELKRRTISGEERDYVLSKGLVTEALCDLGITAVDASDVLDIMLSDYPHKYEEFRAHQRQRKLMATIEDTKTEEKKSGEHKPDLPKIDPEKTRQDMAAAAIASASEWNARTNALRRGACADLQSLTVLRPRAPAAPPRAHLRPPAGFYPHALLPGQYQHSYRTYTPDQLRYFPLNTVLAAPPAPASEEESSESEPDWGSRLSSSEDSDVPTHHAAKRKKLTKTKRNSQTEVASSSKEEPRVVEEVVDLCRVCKMRLEANRRYSQERFLVCAHCNAKLHPACLELSADTIRKCREYAWQCAECKTCFSCRQPADDDKMLFCDQCDRGFHIYCVGLDTVPSGRWHCVECAICKSCGGRSPGGPGGAGGAGGGAGGAGGAAEWHHQTRRGPGGAKVYSHSLCTPCARAYRIGRYCPLCERSFIGPKGTMQLVICKLCDRQLHQDCVRHSVSNLNVLDYTCAECRRGGITSRAAAVRVAPRTIATLFMAKRRFNKYAHRQYLESRKREAESRDPTDTSCDPADTSCDPADTSCDAASRDLADTSCDAEPSPLRVDVDRDEPSDASDAGADCGDTSDPLEATPDA